MKIFNNIILIAIIILLSVVNYSWANGGVPKNEDVLLEAFNVTKAELLQVNINFNGKIVDKFIEMEELEDIGEFIVEKLDIVTERETYKGYLSINEEIQVSTYNMQKSEGVNNRQILIWGKDEKGRIITIILLADRDPFAKNEETNIFIDVIQNENMLEINDIKEKAKEIFRRFNSKVEISTCIIGTFEGKLSSKDITVKLNKAIAKIQGNKIEGLFEPSIISVSVYTPNIDRYIYTGNKKMNLNISMRYNEFEKKTYIWMGIPIITIGY